MHSVPSITHIYMMFRSPPHHMDAATAAALSRARAALRAFAPPWRPLLAHRFAPPACTAQPSACIPSHMLASGVASRLQRALWVTFAY